MSTATLLGTGTGTGTVCTLVYYVLPCRVFVCSLQPRAVVCTKPQTRRTQTRFIIIILLSL